MAGPRGASGYLRFHQGGGFEPACCGYASQPSQLRLFDLYETFWWVGETLHVYFTFCLTLVLVLYAYGKVLTGRCHHQVLLVLTVTGLGLACGTLWEITEWLYDYLVSSDALYATTNPITDMTDTMTDMIMNLAGSLVAGIAILRMLAK